MDRPAADRPRAAGGSPGPGGPPSAWRRPRRRASSVSERSSTTGRPPRTACSRHSTSASCAPATTSPRTSKRQHAADRVDGELECRLPHTPAQECLLKRTDTPLRRLKTTSRRSRSSGSRWSSIRPGRSTASWRRSSAGPTRKGSSWCSSAPRARGASWRPPGRSARPTRGRARRRRDRARRAAAGRRHAHAGARRRVREPRRAQRRHRRRARRRARPLPAPATGSRARCRRWRWPSEAGADWAINDVVLVRRGAGQIAADVAIDGELYVRLAGDGVIVATPLGSSAYSLAVGGRDPPDRHAGVPVHAARDARAAARRRSSCRPMRP